MAGQSLPPFVHNFRVPFDSVRNHGYFQLASFEMSVIELDTCLVGLTLETEDLW